MGHTPEEKFFELLAKTKIAFDRSKILQRQNELGKVWSYSVCGTPILPGKCILFGINWGGGDGYSPQSSYPNGNDVLDYPFIKKSKDYFDKYLKLDVSQLNFNYLNLCFFRSPKWSDLHDEDFRLSLPLFKEYVDYVKPPWLLSIGVTNLKPLQRLNALSDVETHLDDQNKFKGYSAKLWDYPAYFVPHPSARLSNGARELIWAKVVKGASISIRHMKHNERNEKG